MIGNAGDKEIYFEKLEPPIFIVNVDNVGSNQMHQICAALLGKGVVLMGKNTMVCRAVRSIIAEYPQFERLLPSVKGSAGFVFTSQDLIVANKVTAPARAGAYAPKDVTVPAGNTGMEPGKTSFQALGIPTKIARGTIEIVSDVRVVVAGTRVGSSEATLLNMLNISPFTYGMTVSDLVDRFLTGIKTMACLSLTLNYPTLVCVSHSLVNACKNLLAVSRATDYTFEGPRRSVKEYLANPDAFAVVEAAPAAAAADPAESKAEEKEEEAEESDEDMGFGLFD
ncbi:60s acidic ribosomal protein-domain-containing protein [Roridomyces roridus]|uniref:Large ribosomal subunit protein uL10 n=1 Tax=Roridomyces roridus TaxID=1738132 RepID=A0AAD7CDV7_9AGAR|nr:60s acidic ribosomal protein-domain-containing protein [Roridomyces roridus]